MLVRDILRRDNNNFEILRLIAACVVIVGHAKPITGDKSAHDLVLDLLHFDYSGSLAVKFFFLLSGLVVTNSLLSDLELRRFMCARIARIFPALMIVLVLSAFLLGPLVTRLPLSQYLSDPATSNYVYKNAILRSEYRLPGVFDHAPQTGVNGSIWTIPLEFFCYLVLATIAAFGLARKRVLFSAVAAGLGLTAMLKPDVSTIMRVPMESSAMMAFFAIGALSAAWKDKVSINLGVIIGLAIGAYLFRRTPMLPYFLCLTIFAAVIWISTLPAVVNFRLPGDFSYGVYLVGWPAQQVVHAAFPTMGALGNWALSVPIAIGFGALSWFIVEKPAIALGKRIGRPASRPAADGIRAPRR
ncbi:acyltransferase family protein [Burkholderia pseudomallei]|uniref:acyltransferase family protein n=1 Tax=Burkholderia pseudomallei TaxID=28450 RepID=UPI0005D83C02|nr:acyltransferase [Burkholderia pseudomallei]AJX70893.1 acyltransferase family protein [Burkholderia pseudomallei MSHR840]